MTAAERYMVYMKILFTDAAVIHSMLTELSPSFVICHYYDDIGDPDLASRIGDFVAPNTLSAKMVAESLVQSAVPRAGRNETYPYKDTEKVATRLQNKLDVLEWTFCSRN